MSRKVQLRLLSSTQMSDERERSTIRFPRRAREHFGFLNDTVILGKGNFQLALTVGKAYKVDVQRVARMLQQGKLTDEEALGVGFVSRSVQQRFAGRKGRNVWVSDGVENITIGADPEFGLVGPSGILTRGNRVVPHAGRFGSDGPSVEVRPAPSGDHLETVSDISRILNNPPKGAEAFRWIGGATYQDDTRTYWFGGHIHLGRPLQLETQHALPCYGRIATALDGLLAFPLARFDAPNPHLRRNGCPYNYGKAGDIRADYPEEDRFEYRVLSGLWLTHPTLAKIVLGTAKAVAETAYGRIAESRFDIDWVNAPASRKSLLGSFKLKGMREVRAIINNGKPELITNDHLRDWESRVRSLDRFDDYAEEIGALIELVKVAPAKLNLDIRRNWESQRPLLPGAPAKLKAALEAVEAK